MLSKRTYAGPTIWLNRLARSFNVVRPGSARLIEERDGVQSLYVAGWTDYNAAALVSLTRSGLMLDRLDEAAIEATAGELARQYRILAMHPGVDLLGEVQMSDRGSMTPLEPQELSTTSEQAEDQAREDEAVQLLSELDKEGVPLALSESPDPITGEPMTHVRATWLDADTGYQAPKELRERSAQFTTRMIVTLEIAGLELHVLKMLAAAWDVEVPEAAIRVLARSLRECLQKMSQ